MKNLSLRDKILQTVVIKVDKDRFDSRQVGAAFFFGEIITEADEMGLEAARNTLAQYIDNANILHCHRKSRPPQRLYAAGQQAGLSRRPQPQLHRHALRRKFADLCRSPVRRRADAGGTSRAARTS